MGKKFDQVKKKRYRDVHYDQNFDRKKQGEKTSKNYVLGVSIFFAIVFFIMGFLVFYLFIYFINIKNAILSGSSLSTGVKSISLKAVFLNPKSYLLAVVFSLISFALAKDRLNAYWRKENILNDFSDINPYLHDNYITLPEEIHRDYDWFPDKSAHSSVNFSSMVSHAMLSNKGLNKVFITDRYDCDTIEYIEYDDGSVEEIIHYKGEVKLNFDGNVIRNKVNIIDENFGNEVFTESDIELSDKLSRVFYDTTKISYNFLKENNKRTFRSKLNYDYVSDLINNDWEIPVYEFGRPSGAYLVDTDPVNTLLLSITRGGKGQTYIEAVLDMWSRVKRKDNIIINDPKGELLVKFFVPYIYRGFDVVQFNLINPMKTDIYNALYYAGNSAREGDFTKAAAYIENIGDVFFPKDNSDEPMWPNAANYAFKRSAYGLIDVLLEEEKELIRNAELENKDDIVLAKELDDLWGQCTLYNTYQFFVVLSSKKWLAPPELEEDFDINSITDLELKEKYMLSELFSKEDNGKDYLTLFFDATNRLPNNSMRTLVKNADNTLRAMAGSQKTLASVYGIALVAMGFFTDPTIKILSSGKPSQNFDIGSLSFPRRLGVRFSHEYLEKNKIIGNLCVWTAYEDINFTKKLDDDMFRHEQPIDLSGWARYYFDGKFSKMKAYLKLEILSSKTNLLLKTFYFELKLMYKISSDGMTYEREHLTDKKIIKDGTLKEIQKLETSNGFIYKYGSSLIKKKKKNILKNAEEEIIDVRVFSQKSVNYTEKAKAIFLITPPHLRSYSTLILILIKQLVDMSFDKSYITKPNQKPLYKNKFMLDEVGNLSSNGNGIPNLETYLSIGLGQDQIFTLVLQTLQQLKDVYGDSADKIIQGNTSNIVFLKSNDETMLEVLSKLSGVKHETYTKQRNIQKSLVKVANRVDDVISYGQTAEQVPVIKYSDLLTLDSKNSIVFKAGNNPIWNRNASVMPMSYCLYEDTISIPGVKFNLQTIPTLSSAMDFDIKKNQPDFYKILYKRLRQARKVKPIQKKYMEAYNYSESDLSKLNVDILADEIMEYVNHYVSKEIEDFKDSAFANSQDNTEMIKSKEQAKLRKEYMDRRIYANGKLSKSDVLSGQFDKYFIYSFIDMKQDFSSHVDFILNDNFLVDVNGEILLKKMTTDEIDEINSNVKNPNSRTYAEDDSYINEIYHWSVEEAFRRYLIKFDNWDHLGKFDNLVYGYVKEDEIEEEKMES